MNCKEKSIKDKTQPKQTLQLINKQTNKQQAITTIIHHCTKMLLGHSVECILEIYQAEWGGRGWGAITANYKNKMAPMQACLHFLFNSLYNNGSNRQMNSQWNVHYKCLMCMPSQTLQNIHQNIKLILQKL